MTHDLVVHDDQGKTLVSVCLQRFPHEVVRCEQARLMGWIDPLNINSLLIQPLKIG